MARGGKMSGVERDVLRIIAEVSRCEACERGDCGNCGRQHWCLCPCEGAIDPLEAEPPAPSEGATHD
jgi:hypothetical protein